MTIRDLVRLDRALSDVQNALGCTVEEREQFPERYARHNALYDAIEQERRELRRDRDRVRYRRA